MDERRSHESRVERAEELFGDWLARCTARSDGVAEGRTAAQSPAERPPGEADDERSFAALVAAHPELAPELRELRDEALALSALRRRIAAGAGLRDPRLAALLDGLAQAPGLRGRFDLGREIGAGGQGRVVEAFERALGRTVAIKALRADRAAELDAADRETFVARFLAEAQITAQLDHPGVCAVHELAVDEDGAPYFTMARVRGDELGAIFARSRAGDAEWPRVRCLGLLLRVCETLSFAHARGVVHRDLKPANVMVGSFGEVFVMDWGLARVVDAPTAARADVDARAVHTIRDRIAGADSPFATLPSGNLGTVHYMAPEVARDGAVHATAAVDVYAVGAMLHELLTGRPPYAFDGEPGSVEAVLARVLAGPPPPLEHGVHDLPPELAAITARAMAREPLERYADMTALADDLRAFLEHRVVRAHATGAWATLRKWLVRNRRLALAIGAVVVTTIAGLAGVAAVQAGARRALDLEADLYRLPYLEQEARRLWPEVPARVPALAAWIAEAERLAGRLELHRAALAELRARARIGHGGALVFASSTDELRHATLADTVARLADFARPESGLLDEVRARLAWAESVTERTLEIPAAAWEAARTRLAAPDGRYGGLALAPRTGLVPLGPDPASGLEEFAHARSGELPVRGAGGALALDEHSALVLVLVPGGEFAMGAQAVDPAAPGYDPLARPEEGPVHTIALDPFLVAKHEMTQGQWERLGGGRPSFVSEDAEGGPAGSHRVEGVSWAECMALLERFELTLPTEAQWEYAAQAGRPGPFLGEVDARGLAGSVNLADRTVVAAGLGWPQALAMTWLDDGFVRHAPVGSFAPNAFGLHDVLGNVWEWCLDLPGEYTLDVEPGRGRRRVPADPRERVARGGGFVNDAAFARTTIRDMGRSSDFDSAYHGLRPALPLTGPR